ARMCLEEVRNRCAAPDLTGGKLPLKALGIEKRAGEIAVGLGQSTPRLIECLWPYVAQQRLDIARHDRADYRACNELDLYGAPGLIVVTLGHRHGTRAGECDDQPDRDSDPHAARQRLE